MLTDLWESGTFRWGINIDDMWTYAGLPEPNKIDAKQYVVKRLEGGLRGISHRNIRLGTSSMPKNYDTRYSELLELARAQTAKLIRELKKSKIDYVRCWFQWNFFEPNANSQVFQFPLDEFVTKLNSEGIKIVAVIGNGYSRFLPFGMDENNPKKYLTALERASTEIVRHHANSIRSWQIENEPNWWFAHSGSGWRHGMIWEIPGFHDAILQMLQRVVGEESPNSTIIINLEADRKRTDWKSYSRFCDVIGLDFYPNYMKPIPIDVSNLELAKQIRSEVNLPLFIAETGYPSGPTYEGYSEANQKDYVSIVTEKAYSMDSLNGISLWRYSDSTWKSFPAKENHFGLWRQNGTSKPAWHEYGYQINRLTSRTSQLGSMQITEQHNETSNVKN